MGLDLTDFDAALKQHYTDDRVENMVYMDNPLLALMPKMKNFGGRNLPIPLIYGNPQGRSASFTQAQTQGAATSSRLQDFLLTRVKDYSIATIDNETLEASKGNMNAFLEAATVEIDGAINSLTRSLAIAQYRDGWGEIGQIATGGISGANITLAVADDVTNFELDMVLVAAAATSSGNLKGSSPGDSATIVAINRTTGVITVNAVPGTWAAADYLFVKGDREYTAASAQKLSGLEAWNPYVAPTSTAFFGVDRSVDVTRLGGQRLDGTALPIEEALIQGASRVGREGFRLSHYFMGYEKYAELEQSLGSKVQYVDLKMDADIGFRGIMVTSGRGSIKCLADQNAPSNRVRGVNLDFWKHYSLGEAVRVIDTDGLQMLRQASADGVEVRYGYYANMGCRAPAANIAIAV